MSDKHQHDEGGGEPERVRPLPIEGLDKYLLHGRRQIRQLLQALIDAHALVSVHLLPGGESFLTALVTVSDDEEWLYLDASIDEATNRRAEHAGKLMCVTQLDHIRIQFSLANASVVLLEGRAALKVAVPTQILRLQRRESYRLHVPVTHAAKCSLPRGEGEERAEARVIDIGAGGVALQIAPGAIDLELSTELAGCVLKLPDVEPITVSLEVRNIVRQTSRSGVDTLRVGCRFAALPRGADTAIQRYILRTDRELNARGRGGL